MLSQADIVIAGAGLSGLALLGALGRRPDLAGLRVVVIDDAPAAVAKRRWAYWTTASPPRSLGGVPVGQEFEWLRVHGPGQEQRHRLHVHRYRTLLGSDLDGWARELGSNLGYEVLAAHVDAIEDHGSGASVRVDGRVINCRWVFDSVTPVAGRLNLSFIGLELRTQLDSFDPEVVTLLDFETSQDDGLAFVYVLPTSPRRALVERTVWTASGLPPNPDTVLAYAEQVLGLAPSQFQVTDTETGSLPLFPTAPQRPQGAVIPIGASGGLLKASTGYGVTRIFENATRVAVALANGSQPRVPVSSRRRHVWLDALLLRAIRRRPERIPGFLGDLFGRNPADDVLTFLDERTSLLEEVRLFAGISPAALFPQVRLRSR